MTARINSLTSHAQHSYERGPGRTGSGAVLLGSPESFCLKQKSARRSVSRRNARIGSRSKAPKKRRKARFLNANPYKTTSADKKSRQKFISRSKNCSGSLLDPPPAGIREKKHTCRCALCPKTFRSRLELDRHRIWHAKDSYFRSRDCKIRQDERTNTPSAGKHESNLTDNWKIQSDEMKFTCETCGRGFTSNAGLTTHRVTHKTANFCCTSCGKKFVTESYLKRHLMVNISCRRIIDDENETSLTYETCGKIFKSNVDLIIRPSDNSNETSLTFETSGKVFKTNADLMMRPVINQTATFHCVNCGKTFSAQSHLVQHLKAHGSQGNETSFTYETYGKVFKSNVAHVPMTRQVIPQTVTFRCFKCGHTFDSKDKLTKHFRTHNNQSSPVENLSHKTLKAHGSQGNETSFTYETCGKVFKSDVVHVPMTRQVILQTVTFRCFKCGHTFDSKDNLTKHFRTHNNLPSPVENLSHETLLEVLKSISTK